MTKKMRNLKMTFDEWLDQYDAPMFPKLRRRDRFSKRVIEDFKTGWDAALAQPKVTTEPTASMQVVESPTKQVVFTDKWGCVHSMSPHFAAVELCEFYNAWPGGLEEIDSALKTARASKGESIE